MKTELIEVKPGYIGAVTLYHLPYLNYQDQQPGRAQRCSLHGYAASSSPLAHDWCNPHPFTTWAMETPPTSNMVPGDSTLPWHVMSDLKTHLPSHVPRLLLV